MKTSFADRTPEGSTCCECDTVAPTCCSSVLVARAAEDAYYAETISVTVNGRCAACCKHEVRPLPSDWRKHALGFARQVYRVQVSGVITTVETP